jgi:hypothetical protein
MISYFKEAVETAMVKVPDMKGFKFYIDSTLNLKLEKEILGIAGIKYNFSEHREQKILNIPFIVNDAVPKNIIYLADIGKVLDETLDINEKGRYCVAIKIGEENGKSNL